MTAVDDRGPVLADLVVRWRRRRMPASRWQFLERTRALQEEGDVAGVLAAVREAGAAWPVDADRLLGWLATRAPAEDFLAVLDRLAPALGPVPVQLLRARVAVGEERARLVEELVAGYPGNGVDTRVLSQLLHDAPVGVVERFLTVTEADPARSKEVSRYLHQRAHWIGARVLPRARWTEAECVHEVLVPGATRTVLAFAGYNMPAPDRVLRTVRDPATGLPWIETRGMNVLYLSDERQMLFLRGIRSLADDRPGTVARLRERLREIGTRELVCVGGSGGGTGALLYGMDLGAGAVLAFAPVTRVFAEGDARALRLRAALRESGLGSTSVIEDHRRHRATLRIEVYYGRGSPRDADHARALGGLPNVALHELDTDSHVLLRWLDERGEAAGILERFFAQPLAPWAG